MRVGGDEPERAESWISTGTVPPGEAGEPFSLTLRMYNPEPDVVGDLGGIALPRIERESCP